MNDEELKVGDLVQLKSGGPTMTVIAIEATRIVLAATIYQGEKHIDVMYHGSDGKIIRDTIPLSSCNKVELPLVVQQDAKWFSFQS